MAPQKGYTNHLQSLTKKIFIIMMQKLHILWKFKLPKIVSLFNVKITTCYFCKHTTSNLISSHQSIPYKTSHNCSKTGATEITTTCTLSTESHFLWLQVNWITGHMNVSRAQKEKAFEFGRNQKISYRPTTLKFSLTRVKIKQKLLVVINTS